MVFFDDDTITAVVLWLDGRRWLYMATSLYASGVDFENSDQISIFLQKVWNPLNENSNGSPGTFMSGYKLITRQG